MLGPTPELLSILQQMVNLEKLVVEMSEDADHEIIPISLPRLKVVILSEFSFLEVLTTPALEHLSIGDWELLPSNFSAIWSSFIHRSSCRLQV